MRKYRCHKVVEAMEIVAASDPMVFVRIEDSEGAFSCPELFLRSAGPAAGGFLVRYEDGYVSFSPREAFLSGYTEQA